MRRFFLQLVFWLGVAAALPSFAAANPITDENAQAGTSGWEVTHADSGLIDGYADKTSIAPGESLNFRVSTTPSASYRVNVYRLGWYGGTGARLMTCLPSCSTNASGSARSTPTPNSQTGEIDATNNGSASWPVSQTLPAATTANWTTGEYVAEFVLKSGSQSGNARYYPFVVRSSAPQASASSILVVVPWSTYNAYNNWGNTSAYVNNTSGSFKLAHATKVSFNRPTYRREWRYWDLPLLRFLEREGYDVSYVSDLDVDANPQILQQHRAVIISGHAEYWSKNMRDGFDAARDAGTNLFFAGANDAYWQVRFEDSSCADDNTVCGTVGDRRTMVIYKQEAANQTDPISTSSLRTIKWRDLGRPECELQGGVQYGSWFPNDGYRDYTTTAAGASDPWAQGSGLSSGSTVKGLAGFEYDSFFPDCEPPGTPKILFQYQGPETSADIDAAAVKYIADGSGARIFSSGSEQWPWGLDSYRWDPTLFTGIPPTNPAIQQYTRNILADMQRPAPPAAVSASASGGTVQINTTPTGDARITSYKIYRHSGTGSFQPGDAGVTLVCQNPSGDCSDTPAAGTHRYASVAVDQWNDSSAVLSSSVTVTSGVAAVDDSATVAEDAAATAVDVLANDTGSTKTISAVTQPTHGQVAITGGGSGLTYKPTANYCGSDSFTYTLNATSTATVAITVSCVDDPPTAVNDSATVGEDAGATAIGVLSNDTDVDGGPKTISSVTQPANGTVVITGGGTGLTYQPDANYCGADSFTYTLNGGDSATVSMTVTCVDDPPTAVNDSATVTEDAAATPINVLANDTDTDGGPKTITGKTNGAHGAVVITGGGTGITYQPSANYCGADSFTYTLNGGDSATVSITVTCVDDPPTAVNDSATVDEGAAATAIGVLSNDTDTDGGTKTINSVTQPANGAVVITGSGTGLTYQPDSGYCNNPPGTGLDTFTYTLNGGDSATVSMTVNCSDDPPVAVNDTATVGEDAAATAIPVLANDTDTDGGPKSISGKTNGAHGTVAITGGGSGLTYQPAANYCGADSFTYTLNGGASATVSMTVTCVDDPPAAVNDSATVAEDAAATAVDVLANDTDIDGGPMTINAKTNGTHGTVTITGGGSGLTYQPSSNYCGTDSFTYTVNGGDSATVSMTVTCIDDPPAALNDSATLTEDAAATAIPVLSNDTDVDGGPKSISGKTNGAHGAVSITGGGTGLTYQPNPNYCGSDSFTYTLNGGDSATVSVNVTCVDDPPVGSNDSTTEIGNSGTNAIDVLANDTDVDGGPMSINSVTQPAHGSVAITGGGSGLTYAPAAGYCGADSFTYTLNGGSTATVAVVVDCSRPPTAVGDSATTTQGSGPNPIDVLANDTDPDGGPMTIDSVTSPAHGTALIVSGGLALTYQPSGSFCGADSFNYALNGGSSATVSMTVTCPATGVPGAPQGGVLSTPPVAKCKKVNGKCRCKKGFKRVRGKCKKKKPRRRPLA